MLEDDKLITFMEQELNIHTSMKQKLMTMLEGIANE